MLACCDVWMWCYEILYMYIADFHGSIEIIYVQEVEVYSYVLPRHFNTESHAVCLKLYIPHTSCWRKDNDQLLCHFSWEEDLHVCWLRWLTYSAIVWQVLSMSVYIYIYIYIYIYVYYMCTWQKILHVCNMCSLCSHLLKENFFLQLCHVTCCSLAWQNCSWFYHVAYA